MYVGYQDKAAGYNGSILTTHNRSDLTGENAQNETQAQGPCDFLIEKLQREMQGHYSATVLHSAILHIAIRVELEVQCTLHTKPAPLWEAPKGTRPHSMASIQLVRKVFPIRLCSLQTPACNFLRKPVAIKRAS